MSLNHLTIVVVRSEVEEDIEVREVEMIPEVGQELACYHWVSIHLIKEDGIYKREENVCADPDPDKEDIEDVVLDDDRERHWHMVLEYNNGGVDGKKALLHENRWDVYNTASKEFDK